MPTDTCYAVTNTIEEKDQASFFERIICYILMVIGTGIYALFCCVIGGKFSVEKVIFNDYTNTKLAFFKNDIARFGENEFLSSNNIREVLTDFFDFFRGIAIVVYLIILVYMGIRILLGSTAEKGSKHKELIIYWLQGVLMLFVFPFVMKYAIHINNAFVSFIDENKTQFLVEMPEMEPENGVLASINDTIESLSDKFMGKNDFMSKMYANAWKDGWIVYAICWYVMFFQMIGFLITYFKRVLITMFLIAIFPLVMISYAIDKVADGKSQAFDSWLKEYLLNIFVQSFHAITYVLIMSLVTSLGDDPSENWLLMLLAISFVSKGDDILRAIFSLRGSQDTVKSIGKSLAQVAAVKAVASGVSNIRKKVNNVGNRFSGANSYANYLWGLADNRTKITENGLKLRAMGKTEEDNFLNNNNIVNVDGMSDGAIKEDINNLKDIILKKKSATEDEYRNAVDKLTAYVNETENKSIQDALNEMAGNLSAEEAKMLDNLLRGNAAINAMIVGGKDVNFKQNIDIILSCLKKGADGKYTPESMALLRKIANSEDDLKALGLIGAVKFNKDNVIELTDRAKNGRVSNHKYFKERDERNRAKGRGAARKEKYDTPDAKNSFEMMRNNAQKARNGASSKSSKKGAKSSRVSMRGRAPLPGTERAIGANKNLSRRGGAVPTRAQRAEHINKRYRFSNGLKNSNIKKDLKPYERVTNSSGVSASTLGAGAVLKKSNKTSKIVNAAVATSRAEKNMTTVQRVTRYYVKKSPDTSKSSNVTTNYGKNVPEKNKVNTSGNKDVMTAREMKARQEAAIADAKANRKRKVKLSAKRSLLEINHSKNNKKDSDDNKKQGNSTYIPGSSSPTARSSGSSSRQNPGAEIASAQGSAESLDAILNNSNTDNSKVKTTNMHFTKDEKQKGSTLYEKVISGAAARPIIEADEDIKNDILSVASSISILGDSSTGKYTAKKMLDNIQNIKKLSEKYENTAEKGVVDNIISDLGYNLIDFESYVRVRILNDPDSVGNNRKIIEECKDYVRNTNMPEFIRSRLGYNLDDLKDGVNVKYIKKKFTDRDGFINSEEAAKAREKYENALKRRELEEESVKLKNDYEKNYSKKEIAKHTGKALLNGAGELGNILLEFGSIASGAITMGMSTTGKSDGLFEAPGNFIKGYDITDKTSSNIKSNVKEIKEELDANKKKKPDPKDKYKLSEFTASDLESRVNGLKDKTTIKKGASFTERKQNGKK